MKPTTFVLAIDQGTTNTKVVAIDQNGGVVARASRPVVISYPHAGWVEQDAIQVWHTVREACLQVLAECNGARPAAIGISNQRESVVVWDRKTGVPLGPLVVWQCRRTEQICEQLRSAKVEADVHSKTGLAIDPLFSATKMSWLLQQIPNGVARAEAGDIAFGTVDSWLLWNLTGGEVHATDASNASRTQLFGLRQGAWLPELCGLFKVPVQALPEIMPTNALFGHTKEGSGLPSGLPITALFADSHAALFAQGGYTPGTVKATYGTGSSLLAPTHGLVLSSKGLSSTVGWRLLEQTPVFCLEGNIAVSGAAVDWIAHLLFPEAADGIERVATLAASVPDTLGVHLVPAFVGLGAPHWDAQARGLINGLTRGATAAHLCRAAIESLAYQVNDVVDAFEAELGTPFPSVLADGGASLNDMLMQFQSDILGRPVVRASQTDLSVLGAAYMAGLAAGVWESADDLGRLPQPRQTFLPTMNEQQRRVRLDQWQSALGQAFRH